MIDAKGINYHYELDAQHVQVLKGLNLSVHAGEMIAIQGPSGSGKSTLLYLLGAMLTPQEGTLTIAGKNIAQLSNDELAKLRNETLGFVFQQFHLLPKLTVLENILLPASYPCETSVVTAADREKAIMLAKKVGISERLAHYPNQLSGGEQQRVAICRSLMRNGSILLADEPTGNLDSKSTEQILSLLQQLNEEGLTIIIITHEKDVAEKCQKIYHIKDGVIESEETLNKNIKLKAFKQDEQTRPSAKPLKIASWFNIAKAAYPLAYRSLLANKLRSSLTMLGIVIGIAAVLCMVTLGEFAKTKILASYARLGSNTIHIWAYPNSRQKATDIVRTNFNGFGINEDILNLLTIFPQIGDISPLLSGYQAKVTYGGMSVSAQQVMVDGISRAYAPIFNLGFREGGNFLPYQISHRSNVCFIGSSIRSQLFMRQTAIGKIINYSLGSLKNSLFTCKVVGVLKPAETLDSRQNDTVYIPYTLAQQNFDRFSSTIYELYLSAKSGTDPIKLSHAIKAYFEQKYGKSIMLMVDPNTKTINEMTRFLNLFTLLLAAISLVALTVGGFGITNMMLVSVSERVKDIGLRKALGATDISMRIQLLLEAVILCISAGVLGLVIGFAGYEGAIFAASEHFKQLSFSWVYNPLAMVLAVVSMVLVGLLSGLMPALKAEKLDVVEALRNE